VQAASAAVMVIVGTREENRSRNNKCRGTLQSASNAPELMSTVTLRSSNSSTVFSTVNCQM
jgi:hypothetical protein